MPARDLDALRREIAAARRRFGLDDSVHAISCYEAGRDGFWLHRFLDSEPGFHNLVVDSASIEVNRRPGNAAVRAMAVQIAWGWIRFQPESELTLWFNRRFAHGGRRMRAIGIVALARRLLIELWRFVETGALPEGAIASAA